MSANVSPMVSASAMVELVTRCAGIALLVHVTACSAATTSAPEPAAPEYVGTSSAGILIRVPSGAIAPGRLADVPTLLEDAARRRPTVRAVFDNAMRYMERDDLIEQERVALPVIADADSKRIVHPYLVHATQHLVNYDGSREVGPSTWLTWQVSSAMHLAHHGFRVVDAERGTIGYLPDFEHPIVQVARKKGLVLILARHGRTLTNEDDRFSGGLDVTAMLTEDGYAMMKALSDALKPEWNKLLATLPYFETDGGPAYKSWRLPMWVSSDLQRSIESREVLFRGLIESLQQQHRDRRLSYSDYTAIQGWLVDSERFASRQLAEMRYGEVVDREPHALGRRLFPDMIEFDAYGWLNHNPNFFRRYPGGESRAQAMLRVANALGHYVHQALDGQHILLTTHGEIQSRILELLGQARLYRNRVIQVDPQPQGVAYIVRFPAQGPLVIETVTAPK